MVLMSSISKIKVFYCLASLFFLLFLVQLNHKEKKSSDFKASSEVEKRYRKRYNLLDGPAEVGEECTLEYINENKLAQDHPCVIKLIRQMYLKPPSPSDVPYNLTNFYPGFDPNKRDGRETEDLLLKNIKGGFFVECGAFDGFFLANTLDLEVKHGWTGLLIEASSASYQILLTRNRKALSSNVCLSLEPYPTEIGFTTSESEDIASYSVFRIIETDKEGKNLYDHNSDQQFGINKLKTKKIQCFPFYSLLLASNQMTVDFFSLDIEGHEKRVLETIPWEKVDIKVMRIETTHIPSEKNGSQTGSNALKEFLEGEPGYLNFKIFTDDEIYIKNYVN